jgi:hypothetical protein
MSTTNPVIARRIRATMADIDYTDALATAWRDEAGAAGDREAAATAERALAGSVRAQNAIRRLEAVARWSRS